MLPFEALLATLWLARLRGRPARLAIGALALVGAVNFLAVSVVGPHPVRFTVGPHAPTGPLARSVTLVGDSSWLSGPPEDGGRLLELLKAAKRDDVQRVEVDPATDLAFFNATGVTALATFAGLPRTPSYNPAALGPRDLFITRRVVEPGAPPCALLQDGSSLYMTLGNPVKPLAEYDYCPGR